MSRTVADLEPTLAKALAEAKERLQVTFGDRLRGVILYGSRARGDHQEDSDVDLMVILEPELDGDTGLAIDATYPVLLESDYMLSPHTVDAEVFRRGEFYIYRTAKREGIVL